MLSFDLLEQGNRRIRIDCLIETDNGLEGGHINDTLDVQPLTATVSFKFCFMAFFDSTISRNAVMLRMDRIHKIDRILRMLVLF